MRTEGGVVREPLCPPEFEMTGRWILMQVYGEIIARGMRGHPKRWLPGRGKAGSSRQKQGARNDKIIFGYSFFLWDTAIATCGRQRDSYLRPRRRILEVKERPWQAAKVGWGLVGSITLSTT